MIKNQPHWISEMKLTGLDPPAFLFGLGGVPEVLYRLHCNQHCVQPIFFEPLPLLLRQSAFRLLLGRALFVPPRTSCLPLTTLIEELNSLRIASSNDTSISASISLISMMAGRLSCGNLGVKDLLHMRR